MTPGTPTDAADAEETLDRVRGLMPELRTRLEEDSWSLYALGSLGYGNYVRSWSDVDLDVVRDGPPIGRAACQDAGERLTRLAHELGHSDVDIKVFDLAELRSTGDEVLYGLANRVVMLLDSSVHLYGADVRDALVRPSREALRVEACRVATSLLAMDSDWWRSRPLDDLAALLALPARLLHTARTGFVIDKGDALSRLLGDPGTTLPPDAWVWCSWGLACRFSPSVRELPPGAMPAARAAARTALQWAAEQMESGR